MMYNKKNTANAIQITMIALILLTGMSSFSCEFFFVFFFFSENLLSILFLEKITLRYQLLLLIINYNKLLYISVAFD